MKRNQFLKLSGASLLGLILPDRNTKEPIIVNKESSKRLAIEDKKSFTELTKDEFNSLFTIDNKGNCSLKTHYIHPGAGYDARVQSMVNEIFD